MNNYEYYKNNQDLSSISKLYLKEHKNLNFLKKIILLIKEHIYFKDLTNLRKENKMLIIHTNNSLIKDDKNGYNNYYVKYKDI